MGMGLPETSSAPPGGDADADSAGEWEVGGDPETTLAAPNGDANVSSARETGERVCTFYICEKGTNNPGSIAVGPVRPTYLIGS